MNRNVIIQTLRRFKVTSCYKGYYYLRDAVNTISEFHANEKPFATQNDIYIPIGEKYDTNFYNVERGIRVVVDKCWKEDKEFMMEILGYRAIKCPRRRTGREGLPRLPLRRLQKWEIHPG